MAKKELNGAVLTLMSQSENAMSVELIINMSECVSYEIPSFQEYLSAMDYYGIILFSVGALLLLLTVILFLDIACYANKNSSSKVKSYTMFVTAVYPITSLLCFFALLVPRAHLLAEAITQGAFMVGMYMLFCLFVTYCGGSDGLVKISSSKRLILKVGPCCCWPCCCCLPDYEVRKGAVKFARLLVFQLPLVQCLIYLAYLIMWAEQESLYEVNYLYLQPIVFTSIMFGIWGMVMTIKVLRGVLDPEFRLLGKFVVLQLVLIFAKIQGICTRILVWCDVLPCRSPLTPQIFATMIHNTLIMMEMLFLCFLARNLYKRKLPDLNLTDVSSSQINCDKIVIEKYGYDNVGYQ